MKYGHLLYFKLMTARLPSSRVAARDPTLAEHLYEAAALSVPTIPCHTGRDLRVITGTGTGTPLEFT